MKNLLTLFMLFLGFGMANAQTAEETLEWLNMKKSEVLYPSSLKVKGKDGSIIFSFSTIKIYDDNGKSSELEWCKLPLFRHNQK